MSRRAWAFIRAAGIAVAVAMLSPVNPLVLVCIPVAVLLLAFHGRNLLAVGLAGLLLVLCFGGTPSPGPLWYAERAWALLLAGGFVLATLLLSGRGLLSRALGGLGVAFGAVAALAVTRPPVLAEIDWWIGARLTSAAHTAYEWLGTGALDGVSQTIREVVRLQTSLYPALLALASLGSLAVGWYVVTRLRGVAESLGPLREFRFSDQLVWVLIGGMLLLLLPTGELAGRLGGNMMAFMGGLYLLRGVAVLVWLGAALLTSGWTALFWGAIAVLLYPVVVGAALVLGLGDTWLDLRARLRVAAPEDGD